jgi:hypothetical protein
MNSALPQKEMAMQGVVRVILDYELLVWDTITLHSNSCQCLLA